MYCRGLFVSSVFIFISRLRNTLAFMFDKLYTGGPSLFVSVKSWCSVKIHNTMGVVFTQLWDYFSHISSRDVKIRFCLYIHGVRKDIVKFQIRLGKGFVTSEF